MRCILDTHTLLWFLIGSPQLSAKARATIEDTGNVKYVSIASFWEISIKDTLGKLPLHKPYAELFPSCLDKNGFKLLPITFPHLHAHRTLPLIHGDPFDRMIIAQALAEDIPIIGRDPEFSAYGVMLLW